MALPLAPIFIAVATAGIGTFFQLRASKIANERDLREAELDRAREIYKELSESMDQVYYYLMHRAMDVAIRKAKGDESQTEVDDENWQAYGQAVAQWMTNHTRFDVGVRHYFGEENHQRLAVIGRVPGPVPWYGGHNHLLRTVRPDPGRGPVHIRGQGTQGCHCVARDLER